uniref:BACK domain-containing protein n=1 Tax=Acrobeloides nanus TaxID=290746 RepID=A0A914CMV5_9BILA
MIDKPSQECITIHGISADALKSIIHFTYTGEINLNRENVKDLLQASNFLGVTFVRSACEDFLIKEITMENCLELRLFADQQNCRNLLQAINDFLLENFSRISKTQEFLEITPTNLIELLSSDDLNVHKEEEAFESVMFWISRNVPERIQFLPTLLKEIRLLQLHLDYFLNRVKGDILIQRCSASQKLIIEATSQYLHLFNSQQSQNMRNPENFIPVEPIPLVSAVISHLARPRKLAAGVIFCVGGRGSRLDPFRSVEVYDWRKNCWNQTSDLIIGRRHVGVVSVNNKIFAIGGHDGVSHLNSVECFDIEQGVWSQVAPLATARRGMAVGALGNAIYAVGGLDDTVCYKTVERYDIESDSWTEVSNMNVERGGVAVATYGGYLYAVGGNNGTSSLDSCERYDPLLNKWTRIASMKNR